MPFLAAFASLLFPGAGQALTGRIRPAVLWALAGTLPVFATLGSPLAIWFAFVVRIVSAADAWRAVSRARPGSKHLTLAGASVVVQTVILLVVQAFVLEAFAVQSSSMAPTLVFGDHFYVDKVPLRPMGRGDVVVFTDPRGLSYVKRIVAIGGDLVEIRASVLHVNGVATSKQPIGPTTYAEHEIETDTWRDPEAFAYRETLAGHTYTVLHTRDAERSARLGDFPRLQDSDRGDPCARYRALAPRAYHAPAMQLSGTACRVPAGTAFLLGDNRDDSNDSRQWGVVPSSKLIGRVIGTWWSRDARHGIQWSRFGRID